jgi:hypothetical protein
MGGGNGDDGASDAMKAEMAQEQAREKELEQEEQDKNKKIMENQLEQMKRFRGGSAGPAQGGSNTSLG